MRRMSHGYSAFASISAARGATLLRDDLADGVAELLVLDRQVVYVGAGRRVHATHGIRGPALSAEVRPARDDELRATVRALSEAGFGPHVGRLLTYPWEQPDGVVLVAPGRLRRIKRRGVLRELRDDGLDRRAGRGPARPAPRDRRGPDRRRGGVAARARRADRAALRDRRRAPGLRAPGLSSPRGRAPRVARHPDLLRGARGLARAAPPATARLCGRSTARRRASAVTPSSTRSTRCAAWPPSATAGVSGFLLNSPWGAGPAVLAGDAASGVTLLSAARGATRAQPIITLPDANAAGVEALQQWGFVAVNHAERMRLGPRPGLAARARVRHVQPVLGLDRSAPSGRRAARRRCGVGQPVPLGDAAVAHAGSRRAPFRRRRSRSPQPGRSVSVAW